MQEQHEEAQFGHQDCQEAVLVVYFENIESIIESVKLNKFLSKKHRGSSFPKKSESRHLDEIFW